MGVDAEIFIKVKGELTQKDIQKQNYIFGCAFHQYTWHSKDEPALSLKIWNENYFNDMKEPGHTLIQVPTLGRYYGEGYERGPLMTYVAMAELLEHLFPNCTIFYFGDSGGCESRKEFHSVRRYELIEHFANWGHEPYERAFSGQHHKYICPNCNIGMIQNGFKGRLGYFSCSGCGWHVNEISATEKQEGFDIKW